MIPTLGVVLVKITRQSDDNETNTTPYQHCATWNGWKNNGPNHLV